MQPPYWLTLFVQISQTGLKDQGVYTFYCDEDLHQNLTNLYKTDLAMLEKIVFPEQDQIKFCLNVLAKPTTILTVDNHPYKTYVVSSKPSIGNFLNIFFS